MASLQLHQCMTCLLGDIKYLENCNFVYAYLTMVFITLLE